MTGISSASLLYDIEPPVYYEDSLQLSNTCPTSQIPLILNFVVSDDVSGGITVKADASEISTHPELFEGTCTDEFNGNYSCEIEINYLLSVYVDGSVDLILEADRLLRFGAVDHV